MSEIDDYIGRLPVEAQQILRGVRQAIHAGAPGAVERIRYGMPAVHLGGDHWLHYAGWKNHAGIYPVPRGDHEFESAVADYRSATDSVTFLYSKPVPFSLITRIVEDIASRATEVVPIGT
jgi:uncharacterized protein YdhG (YjbR/CyaY superfamily)